MRNVLVRIRRCHSRLIFCLAMSVTCLLLIMANFILPRMVEEHRVFKIHNYIVTNENNYSSYLPERHKSFEEIVFDNSSPSDDNLTRNKTKVVLLWSPVFRDLNFLEDGISSFADTGCLETRCEITSDRNRFYESDAVVFHVRTMLMSDIPRIRIPRQKWIFFCLEAPPYSRFAGLAFMSGMFNWTMTYRNDSDVVISYGRIVRSGRSLFSEQQLYSQWKKKSKMAAWMVSHCHTNSKREEYIREMEKFIDVVTFGECGIAACPANKTKECLENFSEQFFFYLSFENSICDDYITEKFYIVLKHNMIPVVFGGGNYSAIAPPNSYINALEFASPKELTSHLYRVASNFTLFSKYFKWKVEGYDIQDRPSHCNLCEKLHSDVFHDKTVYFDMDYWWVEKSHCREWVLFD